MHPTTPPPPAPSPAPAPRTTPTGRLGQGELRRQVTAYLAARPGDACTPGEIARALGKSAGAVGNALATLADRHEADREPGKPVRYRANAATAAAAARPAAASARPRPAAPSPARPAPPAAPAAAAPARPAPAPAAPPSAVMRPGGQVYRARTLADRADVDALRARLLVTSDIRTC